MKKCNKCSEMKGYGEFYSYSLICKKCHIASNKAYKRSNKQKIKKLKAKYYLKYKDIIGEKKIKYRSTIDKRAIYWRHNAKKRGIEWSVDTDYLMSIPLICYYSGEPLTMKSKQFNTISIERINSNIGYHRNNVVFCCWPINKMKSAMSAELFISLCKKISDYKK